VRLRRGLPQRTAGCQRSREIDAAFTRMAREQVDALFVAPGTFFNTRRVQLAILAARHALPAIYSVRAYPEVGGLISYGTDVLDAFRRQVGDRKSTRLNSSHVAISYAVFCLKKKK